MKTPRLHEVWTLGARDYVSVEHTSRARVLHPAIAEIVSRADGTRLLDYGCGNGNLLSFFDERWVVDVYDSSTAMREFMREKADSRVEHIIDAAVDIPVRAYDVVVLSLVLVCIGDESEYQEVIHNCYNALRNGGTLVLAEPHPCFRPERFSNYQTSYAEGEPFRYLDGGVPFEITLEDERSPAISFVDYHWPLAFTLNALSRMGFRLVETVETPDDPQHPRRHPFFPPYLILTCTRDDT